MYELGQAYGGFVEDVYVLLDEIKGLCYLFVD